MPSPSHDSPTAVRYEDLVRPLSVSELAPTPSEVHGSYCGFLAAGLPDAEERWLAEVLRGADAADLAVADCRGLLRRLAGETRDQLDVGLELLLPTAAIDLRGSASAVLDWVRGFLFGITVAGLDPAAGGDDGLSGPAREAITDLLEITRLDLGSVTEDEASDLALTEVVEFVRVAAMLVYEDRRPPPKAAAGGTPAAGARDR